jgi:hypothetical protein
MKNQDWKGKMVFMYWLYYGLIQLIKILSSNNLVTRNGGGLICFVGAKIVTRIMCFIANGVMIRLHAPDNIIGRRDIIVLRVIFNVDLQRAVQRTKHILEFCMTFGNGVSLPHRMNFSYLQHVWDTANPTLRDLLAPG